MVAFPWAKRQPGEYLFKNLNFWDECVEEVFGVSLNGIRCFAHSDCSSKKCNFLSNKCMTTQQEQEDQFVQVFVF